MDHSPPPLSLVVNAERLPLRILRCERASLWPWWHLHRCRPAGWLLYANDIDGASIMSKGRRYPLLAGRTVVLPPSLVYDTTPGPGTHQVYVEFDMPGLPPGLSDEPTDLGNDSCLAMITNELHRLMDIDHGGNSPVVLNLTHAWIRLALARLLSRLPPAAFTTWADYARDPLEQALIVIERELGKPLYVDDLARRCGMGPQWFSKQFRARFSKSPAQYLVDRRVAVAAQRLVHDASDVDSVAESCGFTDRSHFTRAFSKRMGQSPGRYRDAALRRFRGG
jgi:AraC-like DNA-binding protein